MKRVITVVILCLFIISGCAQKNTTPPIEESAVREAILAAYQEGICNVGDVEAIRKGFHEAFTMYGTREGVLWTRSLDQWIASVEKNKEDGKYPPEEKVTLEFPMIDITGNTAMVKTAFYRGTELAYSDYLSLYKFNDGWKIVAKVFHTH
jgi:hypothetical protein